MNELSPQARALLGRVAAADEPTAADRARVLGLVGAAIAAPVAVPFDGGTATATAAAGGGTLKLVIAFVVSVGIGGGVTTFATAGRKKEAARPAPVVRRAADPRPVEAIAVPVPAEPEVPAPTPAPVAPEPTRRPMPSKPVEVATPEVPRPAAVVRDDTCALSAELAAIQQAQRDLGPSPGAAVAALEAFAARCPNGTLVEERLATRAIGLCLAGKADEGRAAAGDLAERFPRSPSLGRVTQVCGQ